ncbi:hypothetical protein GGQ02_000231 [Salinibacter ruber]|uniref:choice-of-anchor J domain-containing protein n=2 Tax=Salinibacter ruber TaxID=146919 RepID=UPI001F080E20|nr:choice-of-anchor J domain-containing protein [Salinibacter ruber]MCS4031872.1 hypothetical protein [Salinibacter ruber]MCS4199403.1 hypothetical protein [Salinibacter ruber]
MTAPMRTRFPVLLAFLSAVAVFAVGCDGFDTGQAPDATTAADPTVSFATDNISLVEEDSPVEIAVTISDPPNDTVAVEVLYADGVSGTDPSDFGLEGNPAVGSGVVAGTVVFPDTATTGNTQTLSLDIQDDVENEEQEDGIFVLQGVTNASIGTTNELTVGIGAIELFFEDFEGQEDLAPLTVSNVTGGNGWGLSSFNDNQYAGANAFGGSEASNSWLITPSFNFTNFEDETLTFRNKKRFDDGGEEEPLQVKVSTDYDGSGNPENFTWTDVTDRVDNLAQGESFVPSGEVDLSDAQFQGDEVYVAFRYQSSGTGEGTSEGQQVDDIRIVGR